MRRWHPPATWWWPKRPARVPRAWAAGLVAGTGAVLFGVAALLLHTAPAGRDMRLFRALNEVPLAAEAILTPLSRLFLPAGVIAVAVLTAVYAVARNRGALPVAAGATAAGAAWALAHVAKAVTARPRPYAAVAGVVLRQQPAHGLSFPSTHTAVALAAAIALVPFLARPLAAAGSATPSWSAGRGCTWESTIPWTSWAGRASAWPPAAWSCWQWGCCCAARAGPVIAARPVRGRPACGRPRRGPDRQVRGP